MATTTTNFGWDIPQSTDLVKDGATAIAALGQDIDTAFIDLKGGTTGQVLAKASGTDLDFTWSTPAGGGKVLQVVNATYSTVATSSSSTMADTGLTASITPTSSTSKILVIATQAGCGKYSGNAGSALGLMLRRGSTDLVRFEDLAGYTGSNAENYVGSCSVSYLDSPATTSSTTYKTQFRNSNGAGTVTIQSTLGGGLNSVSTITLMEIGA